MLGQPRASALGHAHTPGNAGEMRTFILKAVLNNVCGGPLRIHTEA